MHVRALTYLCPSCSPPPPATPTSGLNRLFNSFQKERREGGKGVFLPIPSGSRVHCRVRSGRGEMPEEHKYTIARKQLARRHAAGLPRQPSQLLVQHFIPRLVLNGQMPRLMLAIGDVTREDRSGGWNCVLPAPSRTSDLRKGREMSQGRKEGAADPKAKARSSPCALDAKGWGAF